MIEAYKRDNPAWKTERHPGVDEEMEADRVLALEEKAAEAAKKRGNNTA